MVDNRITQINKRTDEASVYVGRTAPQGMQIGDMFLDLSVAAFSVLAITTVTGDTTLTAANLVVLVDASSGPVTITLLPVAGNQGRHYYIKKVDVSANAVTIDGDGAETIDGTATKILSSQFDATHIIADAVLFWNIL